MNRPTVVITGATKGLGRELMLEFSRARARVLGLYATDDVAAERLRIDIQALGGEGSVLKQDVTCENSEVWNLPEIQGAESLVLINNAGAAFVPQPLHLLRWEDFECGLKVGLKGSWICSCALLRPMLRAGGGVIVNVLTTALHGLPPKGFAAYSTAKHALRGLTLALAVEHAAHRIRVFSVSPGFMHTELTAGWHPRLVEAVQNAGPVTDPIVAARRIRSLVSQHGAEGRGEDYRV